MIKRMMALLLASTLLLAGLGAWADASEEEAEVSAVEAEESAAPGEEAPQPARGYVLVSTATQVGWLPLPDEGEYDYPLKQVLPDGTEAQNVIHVTPEGVWMADSTCEGHDCVQQGKVTLDNRLDRILGNMIICLPNQVYLQLYTPEEVLEMLQTEPTDGD